MKPVFAIDVGGVLASQQHDGQPREGALVAVAQLYQDFDLWVVSQCGRNRALKTREWLAQWGFPIPKERQLYIPFGQSKWPDLKALKATYFVDDRMKHIAPAVAYVPSLLKAFHMPDHVFANDRTSAFQPPESNKYARVGSWADLMARLAGE